LREEPDTAHVQASQRDRGIPSVHSGVPRSAPPLAIACDAFPLTNWMSVKPSSRRYGSARTYAGSHVFGTLMRRVAVSAGPRDADGWGIAGLSPDGMQLVASAPAVPSAAVRNSRRVAATAAA
jgi:hypothetical protein